MVILVGMFSFPRNGMAMTGAMNAPKAKLKWMLCMYGPESPSFQRSKQSTFSPVSNEPLAKLPNPDMAKNNHK